MSTVLQPSEARRRPQRRPIWVASGAAALTGATLLVWYFMVLDAQATATTAHAATATAASTIAPSAAPAAVSTPATSTDKAASAPDPAAMVAQLEAKLKNQPDDREGWTMLARAYGVMGREAEAVDVFRKLLAMSPPDAASLAQAHADLGRALGKANGRSITPEADEHLKKALQLDPNNVMAHALLGRVSYERGDVADAKSHWEKALAGVDGQHPFAQQLRQSIQLADSAMRAKQAPSGK